jgi:hypothetical protein
VGASEERRAKIISQQADRDAASQATGKTPRVQKSRSNWAASAPVHGPRRSWKTKPQNG